MSGRYSSSSRQSAETKCAASPGGTTRYCIAAWSAVNMTEDATATAAKVNALHKFADKCGRIGRRGQNMWKQAARTLAPDSRHIVAFPSSNTTLRAADKSERKSVARLCVGPTGRCPGPQWDSVWTSPPRRLARNLRHDLDR